MSTEHDLAEAGQSPGLTGPQTRLLTQVNDQGIAFVAGPELAVARALERKGLVKVVVGEFFWEVGMVEPQAQRPARHAEARARKLEGRLELVERALNEYLVASQPGGGLSVNAARLVKQIRKALDEAAS